MCRARTIRKIRGWPCCKDGGAVFVWQGGVEGLTSTFTRGFSLPTNTFLTTNDVLVNTFTNNFQINPAVAMLDQQQRRGRLGQFR